MAIGPYPEALGSTLVPPVKERIWCRLANFLCGSAASDESVATRACIETAPESIWGEMAFYEEVPGKPPMLLASLLSPLGTEGDKSQVGGLVICRYQQGNLVKRITALEKPYFIGFDVIKQRLGIERCAIARSGSYRIRRRGAGSEVILTTNYQALLYPRWLWRPLEKLALHELHSHILNGMRRIAVETPKLGTATPGCIYREEET